MICGLDGHRKTPSLPHGSEMSSAQREGHHTRVLFWICYMLDKDISLRSGHPPLLTDDYCDLSPLGRFMDCYTSSIEMDTIASGDSSHNATVQHIPGDLQLNRLKERAYSLLFSPRAFQMTDGELLLYIRQLDNELEDWRVSIPSNFRPKLSISQNCYLLPHGMNLAQKVRCFYLQLEYHYLLIVIHTAVRRYGAETAEAEDLPEDVHIVMHSSIDLSLEASRSTLWLLKSSVTVLPEEAFW